MSYFTFEGFCDVIKKYFIENISKDLEFSIVTRAYNNCEKKCMIIKAGGKANLIIQIEDFFEEYQSEKNIDKILIELEEMYNEYQKRFETFNKDIQMVEDCNYIKENVKAVVISSQNNPLIEDKGSLYTIIKDTDMAFTYYLPIIEDNQVIGKTTLVNQNLKASGLSKEELHEAALKNTFKQNESVFIDMRSALQVEKMKSLGIDAYEIDFNILDANCFNRERFLKELKENPGVMYILSNKDKLYGAVQMFNLDVLKTIASWLNSSFFVIPSSIHEALIVPKFKKVIDQEERLKRIVDEVNEESASKEDYLSDTVYEYLYDEERLKAVNV